MLAFCAIAGAVCMRVHPFGASAVPTVVPRVSQQHGVPHDPERHHDRPLLQLLLPRLRQEEGGLGQ